MLKRRDMEVSKYIGVQFVCMVVIIGSCFASEQSESKGIISSLLSGRVNIGMRNDYRLQDCYSSSFKQTFPGIDYAFYGYNTFYGYPLADGVDPGFTNPIFETNYTEKLQSSDCKYSLPRGIIAVPSVSCDVSFSSSTVQSNKDFSTLLSASAKIPIQVEDISFLASPNFQVSMDDIKSGEFVKIFSSSKCKYYTSKFQKMDAPNFSKTFLDWLKVLNGTNSRKHYFTFFDTFGMHYPVSVVFGARFTYEHAVKSKTYKQANGGKFGIGVIASVLSEELFGIDVTASLKTEVANLRKSVTTKLTSVGGTPPEKGDAMAWASAVQDNPAPIEYKLESIINLFTEKYMAHLDIDYKNISRNVQMFQHEYCRFLVRRGEVGSCKQLIPGILVPNTFIYGKLYDGRRPGKTSIEDCIELCYEETQCVAVGFCKGCKPGWGDYQKCSLYGTFGKIIDHKQWEVMIFPAKIINTSNRSDNNSIRSVVTSNFTIPDSKIIGTDRIWWETEITSLGDCAQKCVEDTFCIAYSYCTCPEKIQRCYIYAEDKIKEIKPEKGTTVGFIAR